MPGGKDLKGFSGAAVGEPERHARPHLTPTAFFFIAATDRRTCHPLFRHWVTAQAEAPAPAAAWKVFTRNAKPLSVDVAFSIYLRLTFWKNHRCSAAKNNVRAALPLLTPISIKPLEPM